jgi:transposase, IS30 family
MKTTYQHLTEIQQHTICAEIKVGKSNRQIAEDLGVCRQTVWRERRRNSSKQGVYGAQLAHKKAKKRRVKRGSSLTDVGRFFIAQKFLDGWSPEQINGKLKVMGWLDVPSTETIYQFVYSKKGQKLGLKALLRHQKTYRKRGYKTQDRRGHIADKTSIHDRPAVIDERIRLGDLEGDTIIGKGHKGACTTLVDRKSLYVWIHVLPNRSAQNTADACIVLLSKARAHSITFDNGKEFAQHARIAREAKLDIFFADAYNSNQRARNENTNGLIRQYLPKHMPLDKLTQKTAQNIANTLNNRPRKSLNWLTPAQVFAEITQH